MDVLEWHLGGEAAGPIRVRNRTVLDDASVVVAPGRARHPERSEDARPGELGERLTAHPRDDDRREVVAGVAVGVSRAGEKVELALAADDVEDVGVGVRASPARPAGDGRHVSPVAESARVVQHVPDGQRSAVIWQLRDVLARLIVERELPVAREQQDRGRRELLRHGPGFEDRVRLDRNVVLEVRHPVRLLEHAPAVLADAHGAPGRRRGPFREDRVDTCLGRTGLAGGATECRAIHDRR